MIQFCKNTLGEEEINAVAGVIRSGWAVQGEKTREFEEKFAEYVGAKYAVFVDSGTSALFLAIKYLQTGVIPKIDSPIRVPSLTFTATAEALIHAGLTIQFADVGDDYCMKKVNTYSLPVHFAGNKAQHGALIYDSAHRIEKDDVKHSGALWCYSFYATKNMTTVQGGMIATNDDEAYRWLKLARDHGISQDTEARYKEGKWKYDVGFVGWREKSDDVHAAIGIEQLKKLPSMTERRNEIVERYNKNLGLSNKGNHIYPILVNDRDAFMRHMTTNRIQTSVHFLPLHTMPAYEKYLREDLSKTEYFGERLVSIPLHPLLTNEEVDYISKQVIESKLLIQ